MLETKKIQYNLSIGLIGHFVTILLGIILPKIILVNYGSEINGLLTSITNIYAYIAIVEAGISASSCQALYKPLSEKCIREVNKILSATNMYFYKTGKIYFILVIIFSIFFPLFIKTDIPYIIILLIVFFNGIGNVVNYFFHGKYLVLLKADGKNYVRIAVDLSVNTFKQISKIILISLGFNIVLVQFVAMLSNFCQMIYVTYYIKKHYPWINLKEEPAYNKISQSKNVLVHEINYLISANTDTILLTIFQDLKVVSVYSLYTLLLSMISKILRIIKDSFEFKIAYCFHRDKSEFLIIFKVYEVYYITLSFVLFTVANHFMHPFLTLYTSGITDINYVQKHLPIAFIFTHLLSSGRYACDALVHIAGHFKETQKSAITESIVNIVFSIILVQKLGILGVLGGTIISSIYRNLYLINYVNKNILNRSVWESIRCWLVNFIIFLIFNFGGKYMYIEMNSYFCIFSLCMIYLIIVIIVYMTVISAVEKKAFAFLWSMLKKYLKKRGMCNGAIN